MRKAFTLIELMIVIAIIAIIAAIAIPNLLESRVTANEAAASASLKSGVFAAEVQFQGGAYQDRDADNVGEYGTLGMLAGKTSCSKLTTSSSNGLTLLQGPLAVAEKAATSRSANGFMYWSFVPSTTTAAEVTSTGIAEGTELVTAVAATETANNGEKFFVAACAPEKYGSTGRRPFMITNDGQIRSPATQAANTSWFGSTTPSSGTAATVARIQAGVINGYGAGTGTIPTLLDTAIPGYPVYSK